MLTRHAVCPAFHAAAHPETLDLLKTLQFRDVYMLVALRGLTCHLAACRPAGLRRKVEGRCVLCPAVAFLANAGFQAQNPFNPKSHQSYATRSPEGLNQKPQTRIYPTPVSEA